MGTRADEGRVEAIVDKPTWRAAREMLQVGRTGKTGRPRTLLGQIARCGVCDDGTVLQGGSNNGRRSYRCVGPVQHLSRKAQSVEDYVSEVLKAPLSRPDAADLFLVERADLGPILTEAREVRARLDSLALDFADGVLTGSQMRVASERLRQRLGDLESQMAWVSHHAEFGSLVGSQTPDQAWTSLDTEKRRRLVDILMTVTLLPGRQGRRAFHPESVRIDWKAGKAPTSAGILR